MSVLEGSILMRKKDENQAALILEAAPVSQRGFVKGLLLIPHHLE